MRQQFLEDPSTLVVGAKLEGHAAHTSTTATKTVGLTGATCPWNTLAMWNTALLSRTGFLQVSDGIEGGLVAAGAAGVEEVAVVALHKKLFPASSRAVLMDSTRNACSGTPLSQVKRAAPGTSEKWPARCNVHKLSLMCCSLTASRRTSSRSSA